MEYVAEPLSRNNLRDFAFRLRKAFGLDQDLYFPVMPFLEHVMPSVCDGFHYEIAPEQDFPEKRHAEIDVVRRVIRIREDVYEGAVDGKGQHRSNPEQWIHFYTHDCQFERVWNNPERYLPMLRRFEGVITPDFSLYREMPLAMQIWNTYRNRAIAFWLQQEGVPIVPNVRWGDERTYEFAFEGLGQGGTVAVSAHGTLRNKVDREYFKKGLARMVEDILPNTIITYSRTPDDIFGEYKQRGLEIIEIPYYHAAYKKEAA